MRTVYLYGELAEKFGDKFRLEVASASEALRALEANFPGKFLKAIIPDGEYRVVRGVDIDSGESVSKDFLDFGLGKDDLHIMPVLAGAKSGGVFNMIAGAILIVAGYFLFPTGGIGGYMMKTGAAMVIGGAVQAMTPVPTLPPTGTRESVDPRASYVFSSAENVAYQGGPVPVGYGTFLCGSVVISQSITVEDLL